jgi:hypothetical protein
MGKEGKQVSAEKNLTNEVQVRQDTYNYSYSDLTNFLVI